MSVTVARGTTIQTTQAKGVVNTTVRPPAAVVQKPTAEMVKQPHNLARVLGHIIDRIDAITRLIVSAEQGSFHAQGIKLTATSDNVINHGLQRVPVGWLVTDITGASANIYRASWGVTSLVLHNAGAATTISLKVW